MPASNRRPLISGNWKMNLNHYDAMQVVQKLSYLITKDDVERVDVSLHPPFTDIRSVQTVIESDDINAFSAPGGYVVITKGLYRKLNSEAQLAGVLAHELHKLKPIFAMVGLHRAALRAQHCMRRAQSGLIDGELRREIALFEGDCRHMNERLWHEFQRWREARAHS